MLPLARNLKQTGAADRRIGDFRERGVAENADGGEKNATQCVTQAAEENGRSMACQAPARNCRNRAVLKGTQLA